MHIHVFGTTSVTTMTGHRVSRTLCGVKPRQILAILALAAGRPVSKEHLADLLWDGEPPKGYRGTLESYVCLVRRALRDASGRDDAIVTVTHGYLLDPAVVTVDLRAFRERVLTARHAADPEARLAHVEAALGLVDGELLASEASSDWAISERESFRLELATLACDGAATALALGRHEEAVRLARTALAHDRFAEDAWRHLMEAMCATGRRAEALRAYQALRDLLAEELGTSPSRATTDCYLRALALDATDTGSAGGAREELQMLMHLLRRTVSSFTGSDAPLDDGALVLMASRLSVAS